MLNSASTIRQCLPHDEHPMLAPLNIRSEWMKLSIVVPVYNEAATILASLRRVQDTPFTKEIVVVDDGSTDGTRDVLAAISDPEIRVFFHSRNRGKGAAVRTGFAQVTGDLVLIQDADMEYDPKDYPTLLQPLLDGDADVVYGS